MYKSTETITGSESYGEWVPFPGWSALSDGTLWLITNGDPHHIKIEKYGVPLFQQAASYLRKYDQFLFPGIQDEYFFRDLYPSFST